MGTTASTAQQTVATATFENIHGNGTMEDRHSLSIHSFQTVGLHNKAKSIITNKVAPVVITYNCKEEFQIHDDLLKAGYTVGRLSESAPEHYLVQGKYFMVRDIYSKLDVLNTTGSCGAPNFRQAKGGYSVFGMGQPSLSGFRQVLQKLQNDGHKECVMFCVREEPVVFLHVDNDFLPYTPRGKENLHENLHSLQRGIKVENLELAIRKEIHDFAQLRENSYYVYNDIEHFKDEPHLVNIHCEEDIHVTEEVYKRPVFLLPSYRYHRLPLPVDGAPLEAQFDSFISFLRESPNLLLLQDPSRPPPALLFSCQTGVGRTNFAMVLGTLVLYHRKGGFQKQDLSPPTKCLPRDQFRIIQSFIDRVSKGQQIVEEVDAAISLCSEMHDMKEAIYENKKKLEGIGEDYQIQGNSTKEYFLQRTLQSLERYFYLIAFNYYLHEQYPLAFALDFSRWMCRHPELYRLQANMNLSEHTVTGEHITKGARVLVVDERFSPDVLSTVKEMSVANFRRVPKMPVYGMAQPNSKAIGSVLNYLTDAKRKYSHILWVNLREEVVLEGNEQTYTLREVGNLEQQVTVPVTSPEQLEKLESIFKNEILKSQNWLEVYLEQEKQMKKFKTCLTMQEIFNQHKSTRQGLVYKRIPIPDFCGPKEQDFDQLLNVMKGALAEDSCTAFVFNCHSGRGRTTAAMVIAVLVLWHVNGIPQIIEDEIVSVPDAKYTKGEFEVVMKVVQILPEGHRMKKEVDMALDMVSETMTPMHYHLREIIICTYRQGKTAKEEKEMRALQLKSLQYLERYIYLILFNAYLHLGKKDSWQRPFSIWMSEVAAKAGVYEILNHLGFAEFENLEDKPLSQLRYRWQEQNQSSLPFRGEFL
ncbi:paladin isoform X1 [Eublepharis macularius]|uniref:Paladin n=1 Tax=Eublepharis macularius TaxID=481883 RepID=A0AA97JKP7_EUBMA|nr:paladin isoform X1 [Eublepharis macularius]XP_054840112.1 paladin isoform X1 [Eublepharis macularius]